MSVQTYTGALADLFSRAGASDQDREVWLAERRQGVTATEVRDLALGKIRVQDLIDLKLGRTVDDFAGNAYTEWGKAREVVIAEQLRGIGVEPESRVFHHPENSRHLASPDGVGLDWVGGIVVSEIKTCGHPLPIGSRALDAKGYLLQVQWVMHVTGAKQCLLAVEQRISEQNGFEPGPMAQDWVLRDEAKIAELVTIADGFLAELDRQRAEGGPVIDEELDTHAVNYLRGLAAEKEGKALKEASYAALLAAGVSQETPLARVTFTPAKPGAEVVLEEPDYDAARAAAPEVFEAFQAAQSAWEVVLSGHTVTRTTQGKGTAARVTVTAGKGTKK